MGRRLASKRTKEILDEGQIREKGLSKTEFTPNWKGRIYVVDPNKSMIAQKIGFANKGEYALKVR